MFYFGMTIETAIWLTSKEFIRSVNGNNGSIPGAGKHFFKLIFLIFSNFPVQA